ncbi:VAMP-associated protein [Cutaneotrichosporon oleaginosum]|uniref:VAMP-associated protein n=1 Tax=Cutaneotrichosporon oleaginosum TaxID=879819 RepID=A0A0J0XM44_9TREE|nr:VAMP-associated protein [Cutaneotrichosporon oleaginosum]KLT42186.1 VAMP-associated protein [Cutaneotrichosporon oleaginosum]
MAVNLSPQNQLGFPRPLTQIVKRSLLIHNPNPQPVAFKVKTTAPKQYCVRPNQGRVEPGENVEVQIVLQALSADPPPHAKCKDKFLVQSAFIPPDEEMHSLPEMWAQVERTNKGSIHEQKIRCAYLSAEDGASNPNGIPEENEDSMSPIDHKMDESGIYSHAETDIGGTPRSQQLHSTNGSKDLPSTPSHGGAAAGAAGLLGAGAAAVGGAHALNAGSSPSAGAGQTSRELPSLSAADVQAGGAPTNAALERSLNATTSDSEKLRIVLQENDNLKQQIAALQNAAPAASGLRKRGGAGTDVAGAGIKTATTTAPGQAQGVPLEVCAGLVFAVFVLTYLFF